MGDFIVNTTLFQGIVTLSAVIVGGIVGGWIAGKMAVRLEEQKAKIQDYQRRQQVYSQLMGQRQLVAHLHSSYYRSVAHLIYCSGKNPRIIKEAQQNEKKIEDLQLELARGNQDLWEIIGIIQVLFDDTENLTNLIKKVDDSEMKFVTFETGLKKATEKGFCVTADWYEETEKEFYKISDNFQTKIGKLLEHLKTEIHKETKNRRKE